MPVLGPRLRNLQALLAIRTGPGAIKLPKTVSRIHMRFAQKNSNGHMAPRKFWHHELVRLKYHNPAVSITTDRSISNDEEPQLTIFFTSKNAPKTSGSETGAPNATTSTSGDKAPSQHSPAEATETIGMKDSTPEKILEELVRITKAETIALSQEDTDLLESLAEQARRAQIDRDAALVLKAERQREADVLAAARGITA